MVDRGESPPVSDKDRFLSEFNSQFQGIKSWKTPLLPEKTLFRDWGNEAIKILGQEAVPFFHDSNHLLPGYTGFVKHMVLSSEEANFAYINRGVVCFTQKDKSTLSNGTSSYKTSWRDGGFRVDETYVGIDFPRNDPESLTLRTKEAQHINERDKLRIVITQQPDDKIEIRIDELTEITKRRGCGSIGLIEVRLNPQDPNYQSILANMQSNPEFFTSVSKIVQLLTVVQTDPLSNIHHFDFKDGEYTGDYSEKVKDPKYLPFEKALELAFPTILQHE